MNNYFVYYLVSGTISGPKSFEAAIREREIMLNQGNRSIILKIVVDEDGGVTP